MNKGGLALSSLIMAIPAAVVFYVSLMSVMRMGEAMPTLVMVIVWVLMALSLLLAISPIIFLIAGPKGAVAATGEAAAPAADDMDAAALKDTPKKPSKKTSIDDDENEDEFAEQDDNAVEDDDEQLFDTSQDEAGADDFEDNFDFDEDEEVEEEEEPAPKKKKKK